MSIVSFLRKKKTKSLYDKRFYLLEGDSVVVRDNDKIDYQYDHIGEPKTLRVRLDLEDA